MIIDVTLIDETISRHEIDNEAIAEDLLNDVTYHLGIYPEKKYFGFLSCKSVLESNRARF